MKKKLVAYLLLAFLFISMFAGCVTNPGSTSKVTSSTSTQATTQGSSESTAAATDKPLFDKPVTLRIMAPQMTTWPYQKDWYVLDLIKRKTNVTFDMITVEDGNMTEKINVSMASGDVPELTFNFDIPLANRYGVEGAYADVMEHKDAMPNFSKWMDENAGFVADFKCADGKLYVVPDQGIQETDRRGWIYRKDIFDKNGLKAPTNEQELYDVCKKLKELYPDSYPLTCRGLTTLYELSALSSSWNTDFPAAPRYFYYNREKKEWVYGATDAKMKDVLTFYNKMLKEKLMPPDSLTLDTKGWQDIISTNKGFITLDYLARIDFFNSAMRKDNPEFTMAYMAPPKGGANGVAKVGYSTYAFSAFSIGKNSPKLNETLKYIDWLYTPEAKELLSWGEEGQTYTVIDGKKKFIGVDNVTDMRKKYGLSTNGMYALFDYDSHVSLFSKELSEAVTEARKYDLEPVPSVAFTQEEQNTFTEKYNIIEKHVNENTAKFLLGTRPISEFDAFVNEVNGLGLAEIKDIYTKAYNRQTAGK